MRKFLVLSSTPLLLLAACGDDSTGSPSSSVPSTTGAGGAVEIKGTAALKFDPDRLTAKRGELFSGRFVQVGAVPHNIEFADFGVKASDTMTTKDGESKTFSFTPDKTGEFSYVCTIHPGQMTGKITVS